MIEEPALITIADNTPRASDAQLAALSGTPTGFLVDAMDGVGALAYDIKCLNGSAGQSLCGPALTCDCGPADILALLAALTEIRPGDILVSATGRWEGCAAAGDRVTGMAKNAGAAGFITDGLVRDIDGIRDVGLPVYARGLSPNSPFSKGPGRVGFPVMLGDVSIATGDVIVADEDGVVVIPLSRIDQVIERLQTISKLEAELDAEVRNGLTCPDAIRELVKSEQTSRVSLP